METPDLKLPNGLTLVNPIVESVGVDVGGNCEVKLQGNICKQPVVNISTPDHKVDINNYIRLNNIRSSGKSVGMKPGELQLLSFGRNSGKTTMMQMWKDAYMIENVTRKCIFIPINSHRGIVLDVDDLDMFDAAYIVDGDPTIGKMYYSNDPVDIRIVDRSRISDALPDPMATQAARDKHRAELMKELEQLNKEDLKI